MNTEKIFEELKAYHFESYDMTDLMKKAVKREFKKRDVDVGDVDLKLDDEGIMASYKKTLYQIGVKYGGVVGLNNFQMFRDFNHYMPVHSIELKDEKTLKFKWTNEPNAMKYLVRTFFYMYDYAIKGIKHNDYAEIMNNINSQLDERQINQTHGNMEIDGFKFKLFQNNRLDVIFPMGDAKSFLVFVKGLKEEANLRQLSLSW